MTPIARFLAALGVLATVVLGAPVVSAQDAPPARLTPNALVPTPAAADSAEPGSELTVLLVTVGQGAIVWERFGHNAIWIRDRARGTDVAYNWGTFDFNQPNFLTRFLTGDTKYWLVGNNALEDIDRYTRENRSVWVQELNLTPAQRLSLAQQIAADTVGDRKFYRYDYYLDNCSTRVRDALDRVLGGAIRRATKSRGTGTTYRWHTRRLTDGDAAVYTGIQLALGQPADREISAWEESFLPVRFMTYLRDVKVPGPNGKPAPLVTTERTLYEARRTPELDAPRSHLLAYLLTGLAVGGVLTLLAWLAVSRRGAAAGFGVVAGLWTLVTGLLGTALLLAGTVTRHVFMGRNVNLSAYSPLALILLALVVAAVGARRPEARARWAGRAATVAALVAVLSLIGWVVALAIRQRSGETFALALPVNLALWMALRRLSIARPAATPA